MTVRNVDNSQNRVNKPLVATTAVAGAITGSYLARTYFLPEKKKMELGKLGEFPQNMIKKFMDAIDVKKAQEAYKNNKISSSKLDTIINIKENLNKIYEKQLKLNDLQDNIIDKTSAAYKKAAKEVKKAALSFREVFSNMHNKFTKEFGDLGIVNSEQYKKATEYLVENSRKMLKIMAKPTAVGAAIGAVLGALIGLGISDVFKGSRD